VGQAPKELLIPVETSQDEHRSPGWPHRPPKALCDNNPQYKRLQSWGHPDLPVLAPSEHHLLPHCTFPYLFYVVSLFSSYLKCSYFKRNPGTTAQVKTQSLSQQKEMQQRPQSHISDILATVTKVWLVNMVCNNCKGDMKDRLAPGQGQRPDHRELDLTSFPPNTGIPGRL
jgi:hypothetical protein